MQDTFGDAYQMQLHWGLTREMETAISNLGQEKCNKAPCLLLLTGALCATCEWLHPATAGAACRFTFCSYSSPSFYNVDILCKVSTGTNNLTPRPLTIVALTTIVLPKQL